MSRAKDLLVYPNLVSKGKPLTVRKAKTNPFHSIISRMTDYKDTEKEIIITLRGATETHVGTVTYVGDLWCKCDIPCPGISDTATIPYTVLYSDLYVDEVRITVVGEGVDDEFFK